VDAEAFCLEQGLSRYDARLVAWLVLNHLKLSVTSQKQDISDPQVINAFARDVGDQARLDYLYVLTVADVRGTNPKLWNSWKATLFDELYERVKTALRRGHESPLDREELIAGTQALARERLAAAGVAPEAALDLAAAIAPLPGLRLEGFMGIGPLGGGPAVTRGAFRLLAGLFHQLPAAHRRVLSLGMSGDYEIAIEEGSTLVRIGTGIFGVRS
jgi:hypothetical protein